MKVLFESAYSSSTVNDCEDGPGDRDCGSDCFGIPSDCDCDCHGDDD